MFPASRQNPGPCHRPGTRAGGAEPEPEPGGPGPEPEPGGPGPEPEPGGPKPAPGPRARAPAKPCIASRYLQSGCTVWL
ncbi:hypothetical protein B6E66_13250 [Streptomyces maremycinicus]|nr:hypothetical protein B6E66_13250 [Streptomyces sp. B9173]